MNRRDFIGGIAGLAAARALQGAVKRSPFGVCIYSYGGAKKFPDTIAFLDHCKDIGAAGIQMPLSSPDVAFAEKVRAKAAEYGMYYEGIVGLPKGDIAPFEQQVIAAKAAGAKLVRSACLSGRRYETFSDLAAWKQFVADSHAAIERALPVLEKHKVALALENHKDWTMTEMVELQKKYRSEYFGACLDFGNNLALLDGPDAALELVPYAISTHAKDMALYAADDGFLMAEVPFGQGVIPVQKMVTAIRAARPGIRFSIEMISRNPLSIPCKTDRYWVTFPPERKAEKLERTLAMVKARGSKLPARKFSEEPASMQEFEAIENVSRCLTYAREHYAG